MKTFEKFLTESQKPIKQFGDAQFKSGTFDMANTESQFRKSKSKEVTKRLENLANKTKKNTIPNSKSPVTSNTNYVNRSRYNPTEPFMDDDLGTRTGKTGNTLTNKPVTQTGKVVLGPDGKPIAYKGKNIPVSSSSGSTQLTGIKDSDLESVARGQQTQAQRNLQTPKTNTVKTDQNPPTKTNTVKPDQKPVDTTNKTTNKVDKITKNLTKPKKGQEIKYNRTIDKKLKSIEKTKTKPRTIVKQFTTQGRGLGATLQRGLEKTGLVDPKPQKEVKGKLKPITKTDLRNTKLKRNIVKKTPKGLKAVRGLSTLGRIAGGAFAVQDFLSTAKREKAMGRGKTAARLAGLSKALGGYVGGGIGATLGAGVASLPGGIAGGAAGYHYGSKLGDKVYQTGRDLVTGKKTFKQLRKDIGKGLNTTKQGLNKRWNQYIDYKD